MHTRPGAEFKKSPPLTAPAPVWVKHIKATQVVSSFNASQLDTLEQQEPLDAGAAKIVYDLGNGKVFCLLRDAISHDALKAIFYARKLVHEFAPGFVPNTYSMSSQPNSLMVEMICGVRADEARKQLDPSDSQGLQEISYKVRGTIHVLKQLGIKPDIYESNYLLTGSGPAIYVDDFEWSHDTLATMEDLLKWYPAERRLRARRFIRHLKNLPTPLDI